MTQSSKLTRPEEPVREQQLSLVDVSEEWRDHWKGMPEFEQEDKEPFHTMYLHFESEDDLRKFAELTGRPATTKTKSYWFKDGKWINAKCSERRVRDWTYDE